MIKAILGNTYFIRQISISNRIEIKRLYDLCRDYHVMCSGKDATDEDVNNIFRYSKKKTAEESLTLGVYNNCNLLVGMVDIFKNYPTRGT